MFRNSECSVINIVPFSRSNENEVNDISPEQNKLLIKRPDSKLSNSIKYKHKRTKLKSFASKRLSIPKTSMVKNNSDCLFTKNQLNDIIHKRKGKF